MSLHRHLGSGVPRLVNDTDVSFVLNHDLKTTFPLTWGSLVALVASLWTFYKAHGRP